MFVDYLSLIYQATGLTLGLALSSLIVGLFIAFLFVILESAKWQWISQPSSILIALTRGLPEILVVFLIYFGLPEILEKITGEFFEIDAFSCGTIALGLIFAAYASQTLRGAIQAIPKGQWEGAEALGLSRSYTFVHIILPQVWRHALPGLSNQWLVLLKDTALISLVGMTDLTHQAQLIIATTHKPFTWFAVIGLIYLIITLISQCFINHLENYVTRFEHVKDN